MALNLFVTPVSQFLDNNGDPLSGGKVYTYEAGSSTPRPVYTDQEGTTPDTNPVILDTRGEATFWLDGSYKFIVKDSDDNTIWTRDNIVGPISDDEISGVHLIAFTSTGDITLTGGQSKNHTLRITGDETGAVIVPLDDGRHWTVDNQSSLDRTIKVSGQTGVPVKAGTSALLRCGSADVVYAHSLAGIEIDTASSSSTVSSVMAADGVRTLVYTGATGTITLPTLAPGDRVRVIKANATQGTVTISPDATQTITRAALTSVTLNADGDYWEILCVTSTRLELIDGRETGENSNGAWVAYSDGKIEAIKSGLTATDATAVFMLVTWTAPRAFVIGPVMISARLSVTSGNYTNIDHSSLATYGARYSDTLDGARLDFYLASETGRTASPVLIEAITGHAVGRWYE